MMPMNLTLRFIVTSAVLNLLAAQVNGGTTCLSGWFKCANDRCVSPHDVCNGFDSCGDSSDESPSVDCVAHTCAVGMFKCENARCIYNTQLCDGQNNCRDNSDEPPKYNCQNNTCTPNYFRCSSGVCVWENRLCDGRNDCGDNGDEAPKYNCLNHTCDSRMFKCDNGLCIWQTRVCDGLNSCGDSSDEFPSQSCGLRCSDEPCHHNGTCTDVSDGHTCSCSSGYTGNDCETDINECASSPCQNGGTCLNTEGGFSCTCQSGYGGDICEANINFCSGKPCKNGGNCTNTLIGYLCSCPKGYTGSDCQNDIDECASDPNPCPQDATCGNIPGSFACQCNLGFVAEGPSSCIDINECASETTNYCDTNAKCENAPGGYYCTCQPGYDGSGFTCTDIDECALDPCSEDATCENIPGSFQCQCNQGFVQQGPDSCIDINECSSETTNYCDENAVCENARGGYYCACLPGYDGNGFNCIDIDECISRPCANDGVCTDAVNSYTCTCQIGFEGIRCEWGTTTQTQISKIVTSSNIETTTGSSITQMRISTAHITTNKVISTMSTAPDTGNPTTGSKTIIGTTSNIDDKSTKVETSKVSNTPMTEVNTHDTTTQTPSSTVDTISRIENPTLTTTNKTNGPTVFTTTKFERPSVYASIMMKSDMIDTTAAIDSQTSGNENQTSDTTKDMEISTSYSKAKTESSTVGTASSSESLNAQSTVNMGSPKDDTTYSIESPTVYTTRNTTIFTNVTTAEMEMSTTDDATKMARPNVETTSMSESETPDTTNKMENKTKFTMTIMENKTIDSITDKMEYQKSEVTSDVYITSSIENKAVTTIKNEQHVMDISTKTDNQIVKNTISEEPSPVVPTRRMENPTQDITTTMGMPTYGHTLITETSEMTTNVDNPSIDDSTTMDTPSVGITKMKTVSDVGTTTENLPVDTATTLQNSSAGSTTLMLSPSIDTNSNTSNTLITEHPNNEMTTNVDNPSIDDSTTMNIPSVGITKMTTLQKSTAGSITLMRSPSIGTTSNMESPAVDTIKQTESTKIGTTKQLNNQANYTPTMMEINSRDTTMTMEHSAIYTSNKMETPVVGTSSNKTNPTVVTTLKMESPNVETTTIKQSLQFNTATNMQSPAVDTSIMITDSDYISTSEVSQPGFYTTPSITTGTADDSIYTERVLATTMAPHKTRPDNPCQRDPCDKANGHGCTYHGNGQYQCHCAPGYYIKEGGMSCTDINECVTVSPCAAVLGSSGCVNRPGGYTCQCDTGYQPASNSQFNKVCVDIDECLSKNTCDDSSRAICQNTPGSYTCSCKPGFEDMSVDKTSGSRCVELRFMMRTFSDSHQKLNGRMSSLIFPDFAVPVGGRLSPSFYVTQTGLVVFTTYTTTTGKRYDYSNPSTLSLENYKVGDNSKELGIIASYWANMALTSTTNSTKGVYYMVYSALNNEDRQMLENISLDLRAEYSVSDLDIKWMIVVTWHQLENPGNPTQTVSLQTVLATDFINTYVIITYADRGMTWNLKPSLGTSPIYPVRVGYAVLNEDGSTQSSEYFYSFLDLRYTSSAYINRIERIDQFVPDSRGRLGRLYYSITSNDNTHFLNPGFECADWIVRDMDDVTSAAVDYIDAGKCPCDRTQMTSAWRILLSTNEYVCYTRVISQSGHSPTCCYDMNGAIITSVAAVNGSNLYQRFLGTKRESTLSHLHLCCGKATIAQGLSTESLCSKFLLQRPVSHCGHFTPCSSSNLMGDPHIVTLDGFSFTFNGLGEYILITSNELVVQGRASQVIKNGTAQPATYFSSIVGKKNGSAPLEFKLNENRDGIEVYIDKQLQNSINLSVDTANLDVNSTDTMGFRSYVLGGKRVYEMLFYISNGAVILRLQISAGMLAMSTTIETDTNIVVHGLLGSNNNNMDDDVTYPNGTIHERKTNATEQELYEYGETWRTCPNDSLFTYTLPETWSTFNDVNFQPIFFNPDLTVMFPNESKRLEAVRLCTKNAQTNIDDDPTSRRECYFDYKVTDDAITAQATRDTAENLALDKSIIENNPPVLTESNITLHVELGKSYPSLITLNATDKEDDPVVYLLNQNVPNGLDIVDNTTGVVSWTIVPDMENPDVIFRASDGKGQTAVIPTIKLCKCKNGATCDWTTYGQAFVVVRCLCPLGRAGPLCEEDEDGCAKYPCFSGSDCSDVAVADLSLNPEGFVCGDCPTGYEGNGQTCSEINECLDQPCDQFCDNLPTGYMCSCAAGFNLALDGKTCLDIDECERKLDNCDSTITRCENLDGGYSCQCRQGYTGEDNTSPCYNIDECSNVTCPNHSACYDMPGSYECRCDFGYEKTAATCSLIDLCLLDHKCQQTCLPGVATYTCDCLSGFRLNESDGVTCVAEIECSVEENLLCDGGNTRSTCARDIINEGIICSCPIGYVLDGNNTCTDIDECETEIDLCWDETSVCVNKEPDYACQCKAGYELGRFNSARICQDIDECASPTSHNCTRVCINRAGGFRCACPSGFVLDDDGVTCRNFNECSVAEANKCDKEHGMCVDWNADLQPLGYTCLCETGYTGDGFVCTDLNECSLKGQGGCEHGCINKQGGWECFCREGYQLDGNLMTCSDINECESNAYHLCVQTKHCNNTLGGYVCSCLEGYSLLSDLHSCRSDETCVSDLGCQYGCARINGKEECICPRGKQLGPDGKLCLGINECDDPLLNICNITNNVICNDTDGGYKCVCKNSFYKQVEAYRCIDIDECTSGANKCPPHSRCVNFNEGYNCTCESGYTLNGQTCYDQDECADGTHKCDPELGVCTNTKGAYSCSCQDGFTGTGFSCKDIDECEENNNCDARPGVGICNNNYGSYQCSCAVGYKLGSGGYDCFDIDECSTNQHTCDEICKNTPGSYLCGCQEGMRLSEDRRTCLVDKRCGENSLQCEYECALIRGNDTCLCRPGYELFKEKRCKDIDECVIGTYSCDPIYGVCINTIGGYNCSCSDEYRVGLNNMCRDRDGGWSAWSDWSNCDRNCSTGEQGRTRTCTSPSPMASGSVCPGNQTEVRECNTHQCDLTEVEFLYGVYVQMHGISITQFDTVFGRFQEVISDKINSYCNTNTGNVRACCDITTSYRPVVSKKYIDKIGVQQAEYYPSNPDMASIDTILVAVTSKDNALCKAAKMDTQRRRRAVEYSATEDIILSPTVFQLIIQSGNTSSELAFTLEEAVMSSFGIPINVTIGAVFPANRIGNVLTTASTGVNIGNRTSGNGLKAWMIILIVLCTLLLVVIIIVIALVVTKRPTKVHEIRILQTPERLVGHEGPGVLYIPATF